MATAGYTCPPVPPAARTTLRLSIELFEVDRQRMIFTDLKKNAKKKNYRKTRSLIAQSRER